MKIKNDQAGLTLVELLVTIAVGSIVMLAACTMLLFGLRINNQSTKNTMGQNTVQVLMEALEDVAAEAQDLNVVSEPDSWEIKEGEKVLFSYVSAKQTIYTGKAVDNGVEIGTPFLKGIFASSVTYEDKLLTIDVQTGVDNYSSSIYCRLGQEIITDVKSLEEKLIDHLNGDGELPEGVKLSGTPNTAFLKKLASQYGSRGEIIGENGQYKYYSEWYVEDVGYANHPSWNKNTPWCACFVSWALSGIMTNPPKEANVDELKSEFRTNWKYNSVMPASGDIVFFNFDEDVESDHVGVVICLTNDEKYIYTIEGNTAGRVAVRKYAREDDRILGYGYFN